MKKEMDIDKLLEQATAAPTVKPILEIDQFIVDKKIASGHKRVPTYVIYYTYFLWKKHHLVSRNKFFKYFKTKFKKTRTDHGVGYALNAKSFDLTPQGFFLARAHFRKERDEKLKKKQD